MTSGILYYYTSKLNYYNVIYITKPAFAFNKEGLLLEV